MVSSDITVVTATKLETRAARRALPPDVAVVQAGVGLVLASTFQTTVISCGLAGGTQRDHPTGTVIIPKEAVRPDGTRIACDPELVERLTRGARSIGVEPISAPLHTSATLVRGAERERLAQLGFAGADMETAFIDAPRLAAVRVILDTPERELSEEWLSPWRALFAPGAWSELPWLLREGPRCARLAAEIVAAGLRLSSTT